MTLDDDSRRGGPLFPVGALIFSEGVDRLMREEQLDPMPYFYRHTRGDWGDIAQAAWQANNVALEAGERLNSIYVVTRDMSVWIFTEPDRSATHLMLSSES